MQSYFSSCSAPYGGSAIGFILNVWIGLKKFNKNVYRIAYSEHRRIRLSDVRAHQTRKILMSDFQNTNKWIRKF